MAVRCGHSGALFLPCEASGGESCLACFAGVLVDESSLVTHRSHALAELTRLIEQDNAFRDALLRFHPHFLVSPLSECLSYCKDEDFAKATVDLILILCRSTLCFDDRTLLHDFILNLSMHLCTRVIAWSRGQCYMIHALGVLLELHSKCETSVPEALKCQESFVPNLVSALQLPSDDIKGEVLFLLYKLCSLDRGTEQLLSFSSKIVHLTVDALLKTESNELRMNCIALLSVLSRTAVFDLSAKETAVFAEAMKGSLLSTDVQVQLASLQLICSLCPPDACNVKEISILVEEGVADYIFEVLRVSEHLSSLSFVAIRTLSVLSVARSTFIQRLVFGIDALLRVLEHSIEAALCPAQVDALLLLADALCDYPGIINSSKAERIFTLLSKLLRQHANVVEDCSSTGAAQGVISGTYTATCMVLGSLLKLPCFSAVQSASERVTGVVADTLTCLSQSASLESDAIRFSISLLQEAFLYEAKTGDKVPELLQVFERSLLPVLPDKAEMEDEGTLSAILGFLTEIMQKTVARDVALSFTRKLASDKWLSLAFSSTGRFRSQGFKEDVMDFAAAMVDVLEPGNGDVVRAAMPNFTTDPSDWSRLLEQPSTSNPDFVIFHCAIIVIVYISYVHSDRLMELEHILVALEHFIMIHAAVLAENAFYSKLFRQFLSLYVMIKQDCASLGADCSSQAEELVILVTEKNIWDELISARTPATVRNWILSKQRLQPLCMERVHKLFLASAEFDTLCSILEDEFGAALVVSLLNKAMNENAGSDLETITTGLKCALSSSAHRSAKLHQKGIAVVIRRWYVLSGAKANASMLQTVLELMARLLTSVTPETSLDGASWCDIANQTVYLFIARAKGSSLTTPLLILLCLLAYKASEINVLSEARKSMYMNKELCSLVDNYVVKAASSQQKADVEEEGLCLCLLFHLLGLQWERKSMASRYAESISGWRSSRRQSDILETGVSFQHSCQILQYGAPALRILACCCLLQHVLRLVSPVKLDDYNAASNLPLHSLKAMLLLLQSCMLDENRMVQVTASTCLYSLLTSNQQCFSSEQRNELERSPWYCFTAKEVLRSLSSPENEDPCDWQARFVVALLQVSRTASWLKPVLDPPSVTALVANVSVDNLSYWKACLFLKLLQLRWLKQEHIQALSEHFQCYRKAAYAKTQGGTSSMELKVQEVPCAWPENLKALYNLVVPQSITKAESNAALVSKLDEFLKESHFGN